MTPRSLVMVRLAAVILAGEREPDRDHGLRPSVTRLFSPAVRSHDRAQRAFARGEKGRHSV